MASAHRTALLFVMGVTALLAAGQFLHHSSDLRLLSPSGGFLEGAHLSYPAAYVVFAPFFQAADRLTLMGTGQLAVLLGWVNLLVLAWRLPAVIRVRWAWRGLLVASARLAAANIAFFLILLLVAAVPRPRAALVLSDPDLLAVDFHSHTNASHDGATRQTVERNLRRHAASGFAAAFITDHDTVEASEAAHRAWSAGTPPVLALPLRGEEVSRPGSHTLMLGPPGPGRVAVASLPEYWRYGLPPDAPGGARLAGLEIANGSPRSLDLPAEERGRALELAARRGLFLAAGTDDHGWGSASYAWNLVRLPGWRDTPPRELEARLLAELGARGQRAIAVVARARAEPRAGAIDRALDPLRQAWEAARSMPPLQAASCLAWTWAAFLVVERRRRGRVEYEPHR
jgi:hypothetical protein